MTVEGVAVEGVAVEGVAVEGVAVEVVAVVEQRWSDINAIRSPTKHNKLTTRPEDPPSVSICFNKLLPH